MILKQRRPAFVKRVVTVTVQPTRTVVVVSVKIVPVVPPYVLKKTTCIVKIMSLLMQKHVLVPMMRLVHVTTSNHTN